MSDAKLTAARAWIVAALPGLTDVVMLRSPFARSPRPPGGLPFAAIGWNADVGQGTPHRKTTDTYVGAGGPPDPGVPAENLYEYQTNQRRQRTLQVRIHGDEDAWDLAAELRQSLLIHEIKVALKAAGLDAWPLSDIADASEKRDSGWETIAIMDYGIRYVLTVSSEIPIIETVKADILGEEKILGEGHIPPP